MGSQNRVGSSHLCIVLLMPGSGPVSPAPRLPGAQVHAMRWWRAEGLKHSMIKVLLALEDRETDGTHRSAAATGHNQPLSEHWRRIRASDVKNGVNIPNHSHLGSGASALAFPGLSVKSSCELC